MSMKEKYLEEYEKYKHIRITPGNYINKDGIEFNILVINKDQAIIQTVKSGMTRNRTLHWCRKNLIKND